MKRLLISIAALIAVLVAAPAGAYWEYGHQTIAEIAWANIKPVTRTRILALLRQQALLETPQCRAGTLDEAAVWPDCIKGIKNPDGTQKFGSASAWHYQDVNICAAFDLGAPCRDGNCVSAQITRQAAILKDRRAPQADRVRALAFLIHFVGDLHQPLHAGEKGDKGGNDVKADYGGYAPPRLNLHSIWDGYLAERAISTGPSLVRRYPPAERRAVAAGNVIAWSRESWQVAREVTYQTALGGDPCGPTPTRVRLDQATIESLIPKVRLEVLRGGLRLARMLDAALG